MDNVFYIQRCIYAILLCSLLWVTPMHYVKTGHSATECQLCQPGVVFDLLPDMLLPVAACYCENHFSITIGAQPDMDVAGEYPMRGPPAAGLNHQCI